MSRMRLNSHILTVSLLRWEKNLNNVEEKILANSFIESQNYL